MNTVFMISENSKTSDTHRLLINLSIDYTSKNIKKSNKNNKFESSFSTRNEKFELIDESNFISDIQDYFRYIIKKMVKVTDNPQIKIYVNETEIRITLKIKARSLRSPKNKKTNDEIMMCF